MNDKIINVTFPKCGTCRYAQEFKGGMADCYGNPPMPLVLGATQDALGRPSLQIEVMVPKVKNDRPACHLHRSKDDFATAGSS